MNLVDKIAHAVLYEGYMLYPYRATAVKNQQRFNFGTLYPPAYCQVKGSGDACTMQTECLVVAAAGSTIDVCVRFLHLLSREVGRLTVPLRELPDGFDPPAESVESLEIGDRLYHTWQEAVEREVPIPALALREMVGQQRCHSFSFGASCEREPLRRPDGEIVALVTRRHEGIAGTVEIVAESIAESLCKVRVVINNHTILDDADSSSRSTALLRSFASTHTIFKVHKGEFVSLIDPPEAFRQSAAGCRNVGTWPVLVGEADQRDTLLSSPIILYDYPQIAPESSGDLFDGTEIDEMLMLRIMTLTDEEKRQMRSVDDRAAEILHRTEQLPQEQLLKMHGAARGLQPTRETNP